MQRRISWRSLSLGCLSALALWGATWVLAAGRAEAGEGVSRVDAGGGIGPAGGSSIGSDVRDGPDLRRIRRVDRDEPRRVYDDRRQLDEDRPDLKRPYPRRRRPYFYDDDNYVNYRGVPYYYYPPYWYDYGGPEVYIDDHRDDVPLGKSRASYQVGPRGQTWIEGHYEWMPREDVIEGETVEVYHPAVYRQLEDGKLELLEAERTTKEPKVRIILTRVWIEGQYVPDYPPPPEDEGEKTEEAQMMDE